ncbi:MAG: alpha/beta fold hydrolase [Myxococcota bacterium]
MIVPTSDGWRLGVSVHLASGPRRGVVVALPAMMVDARSLDRPAGHGLASTLARSGFEVWRADFRGHGASPPLAHAGGRWTYDDLVRRDVPALVDAARAAGGPVMVLGHSLGAHVSAAAAAEGVPIDALVLLAANVWMPSLEPSTRRRAQKAAMMEAFGAVAQLRGRFPSRRLGWGPADESLGYVRDLVRFWREDAWRARDGTDWSAGLARFGGRVLAVAGAGDALLAHPESARRFTDPFPSGAVDFWVAGRPRLGWDPDHAGLACDARSAPLWGEIAAWLTQVGSEG